MLAQSVPCLQRRGAMRALSVAAAAHPRPAVPRARCLTGQILLAASTRRHPPLGRKAVCGRRIAQAVGVARLRREREARGQARTRGSRRFALVWLRRAVAVWDNEALLGWYRSIDEAVRSKGALYLAHHPDGDHARGRWVGMSYNGVVVSRRGCLAHTQGQDHEIVQDLIDEKSGMTTAAASPTS